ncbi:MAG: hypothetical protein Q4G33_09345 [bacterium]|nr:hypothetical protein [bacterium]
MKKLMKTAISGITAAVLAAGGVMLPVTADDTGAAGAGRIAAFPGAEGGGMYANGAKAAEKHEIYHVTNLNDSGKGSFRDAVSESNRIIVFDAAGNIELKNALSIIGSNLTILGQTAPGDGICIKNNTVGIYGDNVIIRYLRFRMGDELTVEDDSIGGRGRNNVIIDHCSISWCVDECASFYENTNFTMQWCIISESLKESVHGKGSHGYGGIWGGHNASYHHNLIAHHDSRNPRIATAGIAEAQTDVTKQTDLTDLRNNVVYNWGGNSAYGGENGAPVNIVNCYYKYGPSTDSSKRSRIFQISAKKEGDTTGTNNLNCPGWGTDLYVSGNYVYGNEAVTGDNSKGVDFDGNTKTYGLWTDANITEDEKTVHNRYIENYPITTDSAEAAYEKVLAGAGASIKRDAADERVVSDVRNGTGALINTPSDAGGYPELTGTKAKDSDNDGIPNEWEDMHGLNKMDASDALEITESGYTNIEVYANALADGSYVRDTAYDPEIPDYTPAPEESDSPHTTAEPAKKLVNQWIAAKGDENKTAGTEFMPGLTAMIDLSTSRTDKVEFDDGESFGYAITSKINGDWSNGMATGNAMKYEAPQDGVFTIYGYSVSGTKTFYAIKEGAADKDKDCLFKKECIGSSVPVKFSLDVKKGEVYYFFIAGSKMRFCSAKLEEYEEIKETGEPSETEKPSSEPKIEALTVSNAGDKLNISFMPENMPEGQKYIIVGCEGERLKAVVMSDTASAEMNAGGITKVKVFAWDSISGMEPVCAAVIK